MFIREKIDCRKVLKMSSFPDSQGVRRKKKYLLPFSSVDTNLVYFLKITPIIFQDGKKVA